MHLSSLFIAPLLLFFLNVFAAARSNDNRAKIITRLSIDCGSSATVNGGEWIGDVRPEVSQALQIKGPSTASTVTRSSISADQVPHKTARISASQFSYTFHVTPGEKILRLHFHSASYKGFKRFNDLFSVEAGPFTLLGNFSASLTAAALGVNTFAKEFCISVEQNQRLSITFSPASSQSGYSAYAFINGIEIIPVPLHLSFFKGGDHQAQAQVVGQKSLVYIDNNTALELTHRVNTKRDFVSLSDEFSDMLGKWGASPKPNENEINSLTWRTPVDVGFRYLVRIHFCHEPQGLSFKVLINEMIVDSSISQERDGRGILPYRDYVVAVKGRKQEGKRDLVMSFQPYDEFVDAHQLINGFEIFKVSNPDNSLFSPNAFSPQKDSPSWDIHNLLLILCYRNVTATLTIGTLALINIIVHMLREICEASITEEENRPSARAERLCRRFSLSEMQSATKNFSEALFIGRGGFGKVYRGIIDNGREIVAIKRLKSKSKQGRHEFLTEIETLCELRHINLVSLIGYCSDYKEMILVYEFMPSGTLADHLHKYARKGKDCCSLTWKERLHICIGAARGLDYLHTGNGVIHRDVKASNILLDENLVAKVSDFGLAKTENQSNLHSHVSTKVKGTHGYFDPYYVRTSKLTRKSDTYAFGVVMLEVLCEKQAMDPRFGEDEYCLTRWARKKINKGDVNQIVATNLMEEILPESLKVYVELAERCLHDEPKKRPTMAQVVVQIESALELQESTNISEPNHIAFVDNNLCPSNEDMVPSAKTKQSTEGSSDVHDDTSPSNFIRREPKSYKPLRFWAWDAFWNRLKPSKREELRLISEFCEAGVSVPKFDFSMIAAATNHFSPLNKLGVGGFSSVYKAVLPTGKTAAVKRFDSVDRFRNEILLLSSLHHRNIIKLLGYCIQEKRGILLYELMENGSLNKLFYGKPLRNRLQWSARFKVITGIANGVIYLHHQQSKLRVIHRDLNPSSILLDNEMNPKISSFGLARNFVDYQSELSTHIAVNLGYLAPETCLSGRISEKTDVYSFGALVLVVLSGERYRYFRDGGDFHLIEQTWKLWIEGNVLEVIDECLGGAFSEEEALRCIQVGLLCTQIEPQQRPTMLLALKMLLGEEDLSLQEKMAQAQ